MLDALEKTIRTLEDGSAGWVTRRDAALALGTCAKRAIAALRAHAAEIGRASCRERV